MLLPFFIPLILAMANPLVASSIAPGSDIPIPALNGATLQQFLSNGVSVDITGGLGSSFISGLNGPWKIIRNLFAKRYNIEYNPNLLQHVAEGLVNLAGSAADAALEEATRQLNDLRQSGEDVLNQFFDEGAVSLVEDGIDAGIDFVCSGFLNICDVVGGIINFFG